MTAEKLLKQKGIDPNKFILQVNAKEALEKLLEAVDQYCPSLKIENISKKDLRTVLNSLSGGIMVYHLENHHQERGALLENIDILRKYGLTKNEERVLDFY